MHWIPRTIPFACAASLVALATADAQSARSTPAIEVHEATVADLQQAMTTGRATSVQLVDAYRARIAAYDQRGPELNTMIRLNPNARADAQRLDEERRQGRVRGPLHGIPIILKDNFDTADMPTSGGSLALANHQTPDDAFVVRKLRDAGAVILGKSNMHELAAASRASARSADRRGTRTIRVDAPVARAAGRARRSRPASPRSAGDRIPAVRSGFRRRSAALLVCARRRGW